MFKQNIFIKTLLISALLSTSSVIHAEQNGQEVKAVEIVAAAQGDSNNWLAAQVESRQRANLAAEAEGNLKVLAEFGDFVAQGQVIAQIDDRSISKELDKAKSELALSKQNIKFLKKELNRLENLHKKGLIEQSTVAAAEHQVTAEQLQSEIIAREIAIKQHLSERHQIKAPFAGQIVKKIKYTGEYVRQGDAVFRLASAKDIEVVAQVPAYYARRLKADTQVQLSVDEQTIAANVFAVARSAEQDTNQYEIRMTVDNNYLMPGMMVKMVIPNQQKNAFIVPRSSLVFNKEGVHIYRVDPQGIARQLAAKVLGGNAEQVRIVANIKSGDFVVFEGNQRLSDGTKVTIADKI